MGDKPTTVCWYWANDWAKGRGRENCFMEQFGWRNGALAPTIPYDDFMHFMSKVNSTN